MVLLNSDLQPHVRMLGEITWKTLSTSSQAHASWTSLHWPARAQGPPGLKRHLLRSPLALQLEHFPSLLPQTLFQVTGHAVGCQPQVGVEAQAGHMQALGCPGHVRPNICKTPGIQELYLG